MTKISTKERIGMKSKKARITLGCKRKTIIIEVRLS